MNHLRQIRMLPVLIVLLSIIGFGCATTEQPAPVKATKAAPAFKQYSQIVDVDFVQQYVKVPMANDVMIIDSRPKRKKYDTGHIPMSVSIPFSTFDKMTDKLPTDKNALLVFYCGGYKCPLSHKSAFKAEKLGYTNVKVLAAGYPGWLKVKGNYGAVSADYMKSQISKNADMVVIDSRPKRKKYDKGHIPTAINIPDSQFKKLQGQLPEDKGKLLVFYCGGFKCPLSHKSAAKAIAMGHTNVKVFAAGYPAWKKVAGAAIIKSGGMSSVKAGAEEGSIDITFFKQSLKDNPDGMMVIDVRDPQEFAMGSFPDAINIPTDQLEAKIPSLPTHKPIVFVCSTGARSGEAYYMVMDLRPSMKNVYYLEAEISFSQDNQFTITSIVQ